MSPIPSSITAHAPGYIDQALELIVGLQTSAPLERAIFPNTGFRMVAAALQAYGFEVDAALEEIFTKYRKTHNAGVFDVYPRDVLAARSSRGASHRAVRTGARRRARAPRRPAEV